MATGFWGLDHPNPNLKQYSHPRRNPNGKVSGTIVVHTAENIPDFNPPDDGAESVARYISSRTNYGSYHDLVDSDSIVRYLPIDYEAYHETRTNHWAVGISAAIRTTDWTTASAAFIEAVYRNLARTAANRIIEIKDRYGITVPVTKISRTDALNRKPGFIGHGDIDTGRRSDPGANFDWNRFFRYVNEALGNVTPTPPQPVPPPSPTTLRVDGYNGPSSITRYQQIAGTPADGTISSPSDFTRWLQGWLNKRGFRDYEGKALVVDGYGFRSNNNGAVTTRTRTDYALQQYLETLPSGRDMAIIGQGERGQYVGDGKWGFPSAGAKVMQFEANAGRLFR